jgi:hypothetical protein
VCLEQCFIVEVDGGHHNEPERSHMMPAVPSGSHARAIGCSASGTRRCSTISTAWSRRFGQSSTVCDRACYRHPHLGAPGSLSPSCCSRCAHLPRRPGLSDGAPSSPLQGEVQRAGYGFARSALRPRHPRCNATVEAASRAWAIGSTVASPFASADVPVELQVVHRCFSPPPITSNLSALLT